MLLTKARKPDLTLTTAIIDIEDETKMDSL